jgi:hypothetical protein
MRIGSEWRDVGGGQTRVVLNPAPGAAGSIAAPCSTTVFPTYHGTNPTLDHIGALLPGG